MPDADGTAFLALFIFMEMGTTGKTGATGTNGTTGTAYLALFIFILIFIFIPDDAPPVSDLSGYRYVPFDFDLSARG